MQKISSIYPFILEISRFQSPMTWKATPIFDLNHTKIKATFSFPEFVSARYKSVYQINSFDWGTANFRVLWHEWPHPFFDHVLYHIFQSTSNFNEFVSRCKNQAISSFGSRDMVDLKILQSDWPRAFWPISQEPDFPKYGIYARI